MRANSEKILVVGAGVSGLTSALCLAREGFRVTVVAERFAPDIVSVVAGALWEWPPAVCGYHHDQISLARSKEWCVTSYEMFEKLARAKVPGVAMRRSNFYFKHPVEESPHDLHKMQELAGKVRGFVRDRSLAERNGVSPDYGVVDAYSHMAPMIDTDQYMAWLMRQVKVHGVRVERYRVEGLLAERRDELLDRFDAELIVCCAGLGTAGLRGIGMYPLRGALVRVRNDGLRGRRIREAHCVSHEEENKDEQDIVFIVPRNPGLLVLGGWRKRTSGIPESIWRTTLPCGRCTSDASPSCPRCDTPGWIPTSRYGWGCGRSGTRTSALSGTRRNRSSTTSRTAEPDSVSPGDAPRRPSVWCARR